jgi:hypothetical protein
MERREELIAATVDTYGLHSDNAGKSRRVGFKQRVGVGRGRRVLRTSHVRGSWKFGTLVEGYILRFTPA